MDKTFSTNICEVNKTLKYRELASIESNFLKKINRFVIYTDTYGTVVFLITHSDDVYAFGRNYKGRLGFGCNEEVKEPTIIPELCGKKVIDIKCGDMFSVALTQTGQIYTFGWGYRLTTRKSYNKKNLEYKEGYYKPFDISVESQIISSIVCTNTSTHMLTQSGQLYWFGYFNNERAYTPIKVAVYNNHNIEEIKLKSISCGNDYIFFLSVEGHVYHCGHNYFGRSGYSQTNNDSKRPRLLPLNENLKQISCGKDHSLLLTTDGKVYSMGYNDLGQLRIGNKIKQDTLQLILTEQKEICCYEYISMSLDLNNKLYIWGNIYGNTDKAVVLPILSDLPSFQEVINSYAKHRSTLKPIVLFESIEVENMKISEKEFQTDIKVNTEDRSEQRVESKEQLKQTESGFNSIKILIKAFNNPENSDLKFRLKSKESSEFKDIYCHKWFIKESSEYIKSLIENRMKTVPKSGKLSTSTELTECRNCFETIEIQINEYSYESYYQYIRSLYTDSIDSEDMEELLEILSITEKYCDSDKKNKCVELIREQTNIENVCSVYSTAIKYNSESLRQFAFKIMSENMTDLIRTTDYQNMDPIYVKDFLTYQIMQKNNRN